MHSVCASFRTIHTLCDVARMRPAIAVVIAMLALVLGGSIQAAEIGTVLGATSDGSGNLIDVTFDVEGSSEILPAEDLIGSSLVLSTLTPGPVDANRFWTLDGAPEPTEGEALRSVGDKYMGTALQDCASDSQHDTLFDVPILPGPGPEIFIYHGGLNDPFVVLDASGAPALTIPFAIGNPISVALSSQFRAWYLRDNVNYQVQGTFPHVDTQSHIVALDLDPLDVAAIGGLRFAGGGCDYVYEVLGRQPAVDPPVPFAMAQVVLEGEGDAAPIRAIDVDIDGDGDLDIVSVSSEGLFWHENDGGDPQFWTIRTIESSSFTVVPNVAHGDLDGDGDPDILLADGTWYENDGSSPPLWTPQFVGFSGFLFEPVDLDADGDLDVLANNESGADSLFWLENDGGAPPFWTLHALGSTGYADATQGDFDGDGDLDVIATPLDCGPGVGVELYASDGGSPPTFTMTLVVNDAIGTFLTAGDVDRDGDLDFLTSLSGCTAPLPDGLAWLENDGGASPTFTRRTIDGGLYGQLQLADLDLDGDLDLAADPTGVASTGEAARYFLNGGGSSPSWTQHVVPGRDGFGSEGLPLEVGDIDGDGDVELLSVEAVSGGGENLILLVDNRTIHRSGIFPERKTITTYSGTLFASQPFAVGDIDGDGDRDIALGSTTEPPRLLLNNGTVDPFNGVTAIDIEPTVRESRAVALDDFNGDGHLDFVTGNESTSYLHLNNGTADPFNGVIPTALGHGTQTFSFASGDLDGDGDIDLAAGSCCNLALRVLLNNGTADPFNGVSALSYPSTDTKAMSIVDLDGDGDLDLVQVGEENRGSRVRYNNGTADPFNGAPEVQLGTDVTTRILTSDVGDVDGDGDPDVLVAGSAGTIYLYENDGTSTPFQGVGETLVELNDVSTSFATLGDLDADGDLDIFRSGVVIAPEILLNNGTATPFEGVPALDIFSPGVDVRSLAIADLDGNGSADLVAVNLTLGADPGLQWYPNRGGQFANTAVNCFAGELVENEEAPLVSTTVALNARPGDSVGLLVRFGAGFGLEPSQLSSVLETLRVYRDEGSGAFEPDADLLLASYRVAAFPPNGGDYAIPLPADDPGSIVAGPATYFVTGVVRADASASGLPSLTVSNDSGTPALHDANAYENSLQVIPLSQEASSSSPCAEVLPITRVIVVDDTADDDDANPGDGICATAGASCTLRAAITEANATPGPDRIGLPAGTYALTLAADDNTNAGGDLDINDDLTLVGAGSDVTVIDGALVGNRVLNTNGAVNVSISDLTVRNGDTNGPGGGLFVAAGGTVDLLRCVIENSAALTTGGGISADSGSFVQIVDSRIVGNVAESGAGGGVYSLGTVSMVWSEVSANLADGGGGGLYSNSVLQILGSTVSGNSAVGTFGGGIFADGTAFVALDNTTLAANDAAGAGGGVLIDAGATLNSSNNIISGNVPVDCTGDLLSGGYTLLGNTGGCNVTSHTPGSDLLGVDPLLAPLGDYGGATLTHRLQIGSPAIDSGSCVGPSADRDQTGESRPIDDPFIANVDDGCDFGAAETKLGQSLPTIEVPIRWCGLRGAPSIEDPSLVGQATANDVMRRRHEIATDEIYSPGAGIVFRSGGNFIVEDYPLLDDADCVETSPGVFDCDAGLRGDVVLDLETADFSEFQDLIAACRSEWQTLDADIQGITAITINKFIDPDGNELDIRGVGGRAPLGDAAEQFVAGRVMLIDPFYRGDFPGNPDPPNPIDEIERLFGHEMGHALSLDHGNGIDDDADTLLDNNDENAVGQPRFDGPNLLQYRNGDEITVAQAQQMRLHILLTLPDGKYQPFSDSIAGGTSIDEEQKKIFGFGYDAITELEQKKMFGFEQKKRLGFEQKKVLGFEQKKMLGFEQKKRLSFENASVLEFGMSYTGTTGAEETTVHVSLRDLPWYAPIRPDTRYFVYLDLDTDDATGGYPAEHSNPSEPGFNFPGTSDFVDDPLIGEELGVDLILQTTLTSICPAQECESFSVLEVFEFDGAQYNLVLTENEPDLTAYDLGLYIENGGTVPEFDDVPSGFTIRPSLPNQLLLDNGWGFTAGPFGPVPNPVGIEVLVEIDCDGTVLNDDLSSAAVDCQCFDCNDCPDYPGCVGTTGTPRTLTDTRITADRESGELTFEPPLLPQAVVAPTLAAEGQTVTVYIYDLPTNVGDDVEVTLDGAVLATVPTSAIDAGGDVALSVPLPFGVLGDRRLSAGITGLAPRATAVVSVTPFIDFPDNDGDGVSDSSDNDDDNDGVSDVDEAAGGSDPLSPLSCGDADADTCDDCSRGDDGFGPLPDAAIDDDGPDFDLDGLCDAGDADDDNDGVDDTIDLEPFNPDACGDTDEDWCDDCLVVSDTPSPLNDGPDADGDGICDFSDPNEAPVAVCSMALVSANSQCQASASIDGGSFDPEGLGVMLSQSPAGPYGFGDTLVTLTATDPQGDSSQCTATVTVADATAPAITACAEDRTLIGGEVDGTVALADLTGEVTADDVCGPLSLTQDPAAGSLLAAGAHEVVLSATDAGGNFATCVAEIAVLDRVLSMNEKVKVHFDRTQAGILLDDDDDDSDDDSDDDVPPVLDTPHCFTQLDLDGNLQLRDSTKLPVDVRLPGNTTVDARVVVSLSGQVISEETLILDVASADEEKWEYKRVPGPPQKGIKRLKLDWNETASYDSHRGTGLGPDVAQVKTRFIGFDETETKLRFKNVPRPFQVRFEDPVGGTFLIDVLNAQGEATTTPAGNFDMKSRRDWLTLVLPFRLTPDTVVWFTSDGGQTQTDIPVDPEFNYQAAGAKYKLDLNETDVATALCTDEATPVNSLTSPDLEVQLFFGDGLAEVVGVSEVGPNPADWTRIDQRQWMLLP